MHDTFQWIREDVGGLPVAYFATRHHVFSNKMSTANQDTKCSVIHQTDLKSVANGLIIWLFTPSFSWLESGQDFGLTIKLKLDQCGKDSLKTLA